MICTAAPVVKLHVTGAERAVPSGARTPVVIVAVCEVPVASGAVGVRTAVRVGLS